MDKSKKRGLFWAVGIILDCFPEPPPPPPKRPHYQLGLLLTDAWYETLEPGTRILLSDVVGVLSPYTARGWLELKVSHGFLDVVKQGKSTIYVKPDLKKKLDELYSVKDGWLSAKWLYEHVHKNGKDKNRREHNSTCGGC